MDVFDAGHPQSPRIKEILIRRSIFDSGDHGRLVKGVVDFWNDLQDYGAFTRYEVPLPLLQSYHVDYYDAQVKNGGHEQFVSNGKWADYLVDDVDLGLVAMGADEYSRIFKAVRALVDGDNELRASAMIRGGFDDLGGAGPVDERMRAYDGKFFELSRSMDLRDLNGKRLRSLDIVRVVRDGEWIGEVNNLIATNPLREARLDSLGRERRDFAADRFPKTELEKQAYKYGADLCSSIGCELVSVVSAGWAEGFGLLFLEKALAGTDVEMFAGRRILMGVLDTDRDELYVYSSPKAAVLVDPSESKVLARQLKARSLFSRLFSN